MTEERNAALGRVEQMAADANEAAKVSGTINAISMGFRAVGNAIECGQNEPRIQYLRLPRCT